MWLAARMQGVESIKISDWIYRFVIVEKAKTARVVAQKKKKK
jgi:hypothetical protein